MTALEFHGIVERGDAYRVESDTRDGDVRIGGVDFLGSIADNRFTGRVIVGIGDERFIGEPDAELGWGYSEYTPMDQDQFTVGPHDILARLRALEGQTVIVTISNEAINIQEVRDRAAIAHPETTRRRP